MLKSRSACFLCAFALVAFVPLAVTQQAKAAADNKYNRGTVSLVAGDFHSTTIRMAGDLEVVLDDSEKLRIIPVAGEGSLQNLLDVLYLDGIDIGLVQADVLEHAKSKEIHPDLEGAIRYVAKLHNEELHLLVREDIESFADLADKPVSIGPPGSGSFITASALFGALNTPIRALNLDLDLALEQLKSGEIAGLAYVAGKPSRVFAQLTEEDGVKLLSVPRAQQLWQNYLPAGFTEADYPSLVPAGQRIETLGVGSIMVVYNWGKGSRRYRKVRRFVQALFDRIEDLQAPGRHAKWSEVNLGAKIPGWQRFAAAEEWLEARAVEVAQKNETETSSSDAELELAFEEFLRQNPISKIGAAKESESGDVEALFQQFLKWSADSR